MTSLTEILHGKGTSEHFTSAFTIKYEPEGATIADISHNGLKPFVLGVSHVGPEIIKVLPHLLGPDSIFGKKLAEGRHEDRDLSHIQYGSVGNTATLTAVRIGYDCEDLLIQVQGSPFLLRPFYDQWNANPSGIGPVPFDNESLAGHSYKVDTEKLLSNQTSILDALSAGTREIDHRRFLNTASNNAVYRGALAAMALPFTTQDADVAYFIRK